MIRQFQFCFFFFKKTKRQTLKDIYTTMFIAVLFTIAKIWK